MGVVTADNASSEPARPYLVIVCCGLAARDVFECCKCSVGKGGGLGQWGVQTAGQRDASASRVVMVAARTSLAAQHVDGW